MDSGLAWSEFLGRKRTLDRLGVDFNWRETDLTGISLDLKSVAEEYLPTGLVSIWST
jgi:hypothetical protein